MKKEGHPCRKSKPDVKESESDMFNPIFKGNVSGRKHHGRFTFAESELLCNRKLKRIVQNKEIGHKNPNDNHNCHDEIELYQGISKRKGTHSDTQRQNNAHPQNSPIDSDGLLLTNAQWYPYPCNAIENPELYNWNIHLKSDPASNGLERMCQRHGGN